MSPAAVVVAVVVVVGTVGAVMCGRVVVEVAAEIADGVAVGSKLRRGLEVGGDVVVREDQ